MNTRKGVVHTLEAVLASTLVLGVVLNVIPEFQPDRSTEPQQQVRSGLESLEKTGKLTDNLTTGEVESEIESYIPYGYNYSVSIVETQRISDSISGTEETYIETQGNYSEILLWVESSNSIDATFNGETVLQGYTGEGFETVPVSSSEGWLNFSGTADLDYNFVTYSSKRKDIDQNQVSVVNYITEDNGTKEVQVRLWS